MNVYHNFKYFLWLSIIVKDLYRIGTIIKVKSPGRLIIFWNNEYQAQECVIRQENKYLFRFANCFGEDIDRSLNFKDKNNAELSEDESNYLFLSKKVTNIVNVYDD